jgi:imidazolonepropionase-like amidohydrolase
MNDGPERIAVIGGVVIDGNGGTPIDDGVVLIDGKRIVAVGDRSTAIPPRAKTIAATGKFIIPGLMDVSVYLVGDYRCVPTLIRYEGRYDQLAVEAAQIALKNGLTTVFDTWGPRDDLIKARDAVDQGKVVAARIYVAGNMIGLDGPFSDDFNNRSREGLPLNFVARMNVRWQHNVGEELTLMSPEKVREEIRKYIQTGIDYLNVEITVHRVGAQQFFQFAPRVLRAIVEEAHHAGLVVVGNHTYGNEGFVEAADAGVDLPNLGIYQPIPDETVALIAQRQIPCSITPFVREVLAWHRQRLTNDSTSSARWFSNVIETMNLNWHAAHRSGAPVMPGTGAAIYSKDTLNDPEWKKADPPAGSTAILGEGFFNCLQGMQEMGMEPMAVLMAATRNIARAYKVDKDLGTLERGKFADLLILDRNPLENAENYRSIHLVMKEGKAIDRDALPTQRLLTAPSAESK